MRRLAALLAALALAPALLPAPAGAGHFGEQCGGNWTASASCRISFFGPPITSYADAVPRPGHTGPLRVHAWLTVYGTDAPRLMECEATGTASATCDRGLGTYPGADLGPTPLAFECHVEGSPGGWYACGSGRGA